MSDLLPSWNDGVAKHAILSFLEGTTTPDSPTFVAVADRIATFDNDGTLWVEKPMYIQLQHGLRAVAKMAQEHPEVADRQPFKAVSELDMAWLEQISADYANGDPTGLMTLASGIAEATDGTTVEDFEAEALAFLSDNQDSRFAVPYKQLVYAPMVELVKVLQDHGFQVFLASGGGRDFMRAVSMELYGIPPSMTIGSSITTEYAEDADGIAQVMRTKEIELPVDDGPGKPLHIHRAIGRRPVMAAGNSDGDIHMLKYASGHAGPTLALLVHHDDDAREYAYDAGSEKALALASTEGWIVISIKDDWKTVFPA